MQSIFQVSQIDTRDKAFVKMNSYAFQKMVGIFPVVDQLSIGIFLWLIKIVREIARITDMVLKIINFLLVEIDGRLVDNRLQNFITCLRSPYKENGNNLEGKVNW